MLNEASFIDPGQSPQIRFNIMTPIVCMAYGEKTTFCMTLFKKYINEGAMLKRSAEKSPTLRVEEIGCFELKTRTNQPCFVHLYDSRGYGDFINNQAAVDEVKKFLVEKHLKWLNIRGQETSEDDRASGDERIHLIFYFFSPHRHKAIDKAFLMELKDVANIVPIIGKSDVMTITERRQYLEEIQDLLQSLKSENGVQIFDFHEEGDFISCHQQLTVEPAVFIPTNEEVQGLSPASHSSHLEESRITGDPAVTPEDVDGPVNNPQSDDEVIVESKISYRSSTSNIESKRQASGTYPVAVTVFPTAISRTGTEDNMNQSSAYHQSQSMAVLELPRIPNVFAICSDEAGYRRYPWGTVETENPLHSDFPRLRSLVFEKGYINQLRSATQSFTAKIYSMEKKRRRRYSMIKTFLISTLVMLVLVLFPFRQSLFRPWTEATDRSGSPTTGNNSNTIRAKEASITKIPTTVLHSRHET